MPSRTQLLIGKLASRVWDGRAAGAGFGLGLVMGHDTKSVECVWALVSVFLRPRGPPTELEVPASACFDACGRIGSLHRIFVATTQGSALLQHSIRMHFPKGFES